MKLNFKDASFMFESEDSILYMAIIHLFSDGLRLWAVYANGIHLAYIQEEKSVQYVSHTRAEQVVEQAVNALKINPESGK
jgi:hypothetical protein